jgi:parvulin-like peptidyl-prolyl isomerase
MYRILLMSCGLTLAGALAQGQAPASSQKQVPQQYVRETPLHAGDPRLQPPQNSGPDHVPPDAVVIEIHGLCPPDSDGVLTKQESCTTKMTKAQFTTMLAALNVNNQQMSVVAMRSLAQSYIELMSMAAAAQSAGADKDPRFAELMRVVRIRTLADLYRRSLEEKYANPSQEQIESYYNENKAKFEELRLDRIFIPKVSPKLLPAQQVEFNKKAAKVAEQIRERAVNGEDMTKLQSEASKTLDLTTPATVDIGARRRGTMTAAIEKDVFALKGGEVTKVELEPSGYNIYKLRSRDTVPLEQAKNEIARELHRREMEAAMKAVSQSVHAELNDQFFKPQPPPGAQPRTPAQMVPLNPPPASAPDPSSSAAATAPPATSAAAPATPAARNPK